MAQKVHAEVEGATESESDAGAEAEGADDGAMLEFETEEELHERLQEEAHLGATALTPLGWLKSVSNQSCLTQTILVAMSECLLLLLWR